MTIHELKTVNPFFEAVYTGFKDFELRKNDRNFKVGDRLKLVEFEKGKTTKRFVLKDVKYILAGGQFGLSYDYVILGLKDVK